MGFLQGPVTNADDCGISWSTCWSFGLTVSQYYALLAAIMFILFIPICFLNEPDPSLVPRHSVREFGTKMWDTMQNLTTWRLLIYVVGISALANFVSNAAIYLQV